MNVKKKIGIFIGFLVSACLANVDVNMAKPFDSGLVDAVVHILESCYINRKIPIGLAGNGVGMISKRLWSEERSSVTLFDVTSRIVSNPPVDPRSRHKLQIFVVSASSSASLARTLREIKASLWWNHMATFFIFDSSSVGCLSAPEMLWIAWEMNVISASLLCYDRKRGRLIYTFNPYTSQAPDLWQLDRTLSGKNDHPWTLFVRGFAKDDQICNDLDFDKTKDLGGYEIRVSATAETFGYHTGETNRRCFGVFDDVHCKLILMALNATLKVLWHRSADDVGFVDDGGNITGILAEVATGWADIASLPRYVTSVSNLTTAYPHLRSGLFALTHYNGFRSQLSKIFTVIDSSSRFGLWVVLLITILFFKYFVRQSLTNACLNTLRIVCNSTPLNIPRKLALRFYLGGLFAFMLTIQGIYQGKLASLLTSPEPRRNVDTMTDLAELGHTIYGSGTYRLYFSAPEFRGRYVGMKKVLCTDYVSSHPNAACIGDGYWLMHDATKTKLHISRRALAVIFSAMPIRPDWPLEERINTILMRSLQAYLIPYSYQNVTSGTYRFLVSRELKHKDPRPKVLMLNQLNFAFATLGIGIACASVSFIVESSYARIMLWHQRKNVKNNLK